MSSTVSILRVGSSSNEGLSESLINSIVGFLHKREQDSSTTTPSSNGNNLIKISNRYFDATLALKPLDILSTGGEEDGGKEDGILLVFDDTSKESFNVISQLHAKAETNQQNGDLLRLCIGVINNDNASTAPIMSSKEREEEYSRRVLWCLDFGYEYIEKVDLSAEGQQRGHEAREKEGFARIIEALQGTVWSSARMHPKKKVALQNSYQNDTKQLTTTQTKEEENNTTYEPPTTTTVPETTTENTTTTTAISEKEDKQREESARQALLKQDGINNSQEDNPQYIDGKEGGPSQAAAEEKMREIKADKIMGDMENALKEANRIRDMSKAGEFLSDEDRKKRAGDAATLILNLMNQMGGLDDDDESDEGEEGSDVEN